MHILKNILKNTILKLESELFSLRTAPKKRKNPRIANGEAVKQTVMIETGSKNNRNQRDLTKRGRGNEFMRGVGGVCVDREISGMLRTPQQTASD